ncbi:MAG TPA: F0F1 ATP synthase subunit A, partial [Sulfurimonas autotrophica]|nr:F0F1 ATP synthase subunit A [Sulfurimonas autotrophica]
MGELFTFFGLISEDHDFLFLTHMVLSALIAIVLAKVAMSNLQLVPKGTQNLMEAYVNGVLEMGTDVMGKAHARKYVALVATIGLFVFIANFIGIIPGFEAPSANLNMTLTLALVVFVYYNYVGIKTHGIVKYLAHFT